MLRQNWGSKVLIVLVTPLAMYLGLVVGAYALYQVDQTTNEFVAVIGFGVVSAYPWVPKITAPSSSPPFCAHHTCSAIVVGVGSPRCFTSQ